MGTKVFVERLVGLGSVVYEQILYDGDTLLAEIEVFYIVSFIVF